MLTNVLGLAKIEKVAGQELSGLNATITLSRLLFAGVAQFGRATDL